MTIVRYTLDPDHPPKLSKEAKQRYDAIRDRDIDYSDIPELDEDFFKRALKPQEAPTKEKISVRLDSDVLQWLRGYGRGYQTRINDILRLAMEHQTPS